MVDVGSPSTELTEKLRITIQDLRKYNELERYEFILEAADIKEALVQALEEYNDTVTPTAHTFTNMNEVRISFFMRLATSYAYRMIYSRKLWNSLAFSDGGFSVDENALLPFIKALYEQERGLALSQISVAKNADAINNSFVGGFTFEY
jgi:hypothetical protein